MVQDFDATNLGAGFEGNNEMRLPLAIPSFVWTGFFTYDLNDFALLQNLFGHEWMPALPLQVSAATGGLSAALVSTVLSAFSEPAPALAPLCQDLVGHSAWWELHWPSVVVGILLGLLLGKALEFCVLLRHYLGLQIRQRSWAWSNSLAVRARSG